MAKNYLLAVGMAIDNDDIFVMRLRAACSLMGIEYTRQIGFDIAVRVAGDIQIKGDASEPAICTTCVDDDRIIEALGEITGDTEKAAALLATFEITTPNPEPEPGTDDPQDEEDGDAH